ncbi:hypothetical protein DFJ73DRAFT_801658 [Zopfochytrium polystomum]|nr:hypothetical protein DFJ73DRAFT_801658 [Zopfochytrium polystomum]
MTEALTPPAAAAATISITNRPFSSIALLCCILTSPTRDTMLRWSTATIVPAAAAATAATAEIVLRGPSGSSSSHHQPPPPAAAAIPAALATVKHPSLSLSVSSSSNSSSSALEPISIDDAVDRDLAEPLAGKEDAATHSFESYPDGLVAEGLAPASTLQWIDSVQASVESVIALPGARLVDQLKSAFKDKRFILLLVGSSIAIFHLFVPPFFLPLYANSVGLSTSMSLLVVAGFNLSSAAGRFGFGVFADLLLGSLNSFVVCLFLVGISTLVIWPLATSVAPLVVFRNRERAVAQRYGSSFYPPIQPIGEDGDGVQHVAATASAARRRRRGDPA